MKTILNYKTIIFVAVLFIALNSFASAPAHLQWLGFYNSETWSEADASNFVLIRDLSLINDADSRGKAVFVEIGKVFCTEVWVGDSWAGWTLRSDWQQCWNAFVDLAAPLLASGHIKGFMILDEPVWTGLEVSELNTIANAIKSDFPTAIVMVVEAAAVFTEDKNVFGETINFDPIPSGIDWIGFDQYTDPTIVQSNYQTYLYPRMTAGQKAMIVPQAFGSEGNPSKTLTQYDQSNVTDAEAYYQWAKSDTNIVCIMPWHWMDVNFTASELERFWSLENYWEIGARNMPLTRAKYEQIGSEIIANNQPAVLGAVDLVQNWDTFSNGEQLPSIYEYDPWWPNGLPTSTVSFSTEESYSGTTSVQLKTSGAKMRYCWGTNDRNSASSRQWDGQSIQNFEFMVKINEASTNLYFYPYRIWQTPCSFRIVTWGFEMIDGGGSYIRLANMSDFIDDDWNKIRVRIDLGDQNDRNDNWLTVWLNDVIIYDQSFVSIDEVTFNSIGFIQWAATDTYIDDIAMLGEVGCGDWGISAADVNKDCVVDIRDFAQIAASWGRCTDPEDLFCDEIN